MKCLILASGFGTRLYPLTLSKAKALLDYRGAPLISHVVDKVPEGMEIFVTSNGKFEGDLHRWAANLRREVNLCVEPVLTEKDSLGAVGSLDYCIRTKKITDDLLVVGADNYFEFSLSDFIAAFDRQTTLVAIYDVKDPQKATQFGVVKLEGDRIVAFEEKPQRPKSSLVATACWILPSRILPVIGEFTQIGRNDNMGDFIAYLVGKDEVRAYVFSELWLDIGSTEVYYNTR